MSNEELIKILDALKLEGVSYKFLAKISGLSYDSFYYYRRCKQFPLVERIKVVDAITKQFGEYIDEFSK